jgi:hypothetical protein
VIGLSADYTGRNGQRRLLDYEARQALLGQFERLGEEGYRVLGVASRGVAR